MTAVELPRALRPWAASLALLDPEVHDEVGRWLDPLRSLLGPLAVPSAASMGEPDGHAGLDRRGPYERLLVSEWLLADELPDEFLRRAAMSEHLFLAHELREPRAAGTSVALVDCGPMQLGTPRLAQLAVLMVLQQRAAEQGAQLRFGVLQDDEHRLLELTTPGLIAWLHARTWRAAEPCVAAWGERLAELETTDAWLLGSARLRAHAEAMGAGSIEIEESFEAGATALRVRAHRHGRAGHAITLPLPPPSTCLRILRAPLLRSRLEPSAQTRRSAAELGQLSVNGSRWLLAREDGGLEALHVPSSLHQRRGHDKVIVPRPGCTLVAACMRGKRPIALEHTMRGVLLLRGSGLVTPGGRRARSLGELIDTELVAPPSLGRGSPLPATMVVTRAELLSFAAWLVDGEGQLWQLLLELAPKSLGVRDRSLVRHDRVRPSIRCLDAQTLAWMSDDDGCVKTSRPLPGDDLLPPELHHADLVIGPLRVHGREALRVAALPRGGDSLVVVDGTSPGSLRRVPVPSGRVFGLGSSRQATPPGALVVLYVRLDETTVWRRGLDGSDTLLFSTASPIVEIRHEPSCNRIVWCTRGGERGIYDLHEARMALRLLADEREGAEP